MKFISNQIKQSRYDQNLFHVNDVEQIDQKDVFVRYDTFDVETVQDVFETKGVPGLFISDCIVYYENFYKGVKFVGLPIWLNAGRKNWKPEEFVEERPLTTSCFNFMVNKKQINRYLCIKLIELFECKNFVYTWSGVDNYFDCSVIIQEHAQLGKTSPVNQLQFSEILSPIKTAARFIFPDEYKKQKTEENIGAIINYGVIRNTWDWGLNQMFSQSAVSLITESIAYQKAIMFTEKTLFCLFGLNFPIWIGGYKQAEMWQRLGFDTFADIINHDYQYYDTMLERCCYAFILNKKILTDLDYAKSQRKKHIDRLLLNRHSILSSESIQNYIDTELQKHSYIKNNFHQKVMKQFTGSEWTYLKDN